MTRPHSCWLQRNSLWAVCEHDFCWFLRRAPSRLQSGRRLVSGTQRSTWSVLKWSQSWPTQW